MALPFSRSTGVRVMTLIALSYTLSWGAETSYPPVRIAMRNVRLRVADGIVLDVKNLQGEMISRRAGEPPVFNDPESFLVRVSAGEAAMTTESLTELLNRRLFAYEGAPLEKLKAETDGNRLKLSGQLRKGVDVPFSVVSELSVTPDGRLLLHADKVKAVGLPAKGLMDFFGLELDEVVSLEKARGVAVKDNDLFLDPGRILPPPMIEGKLATVRVEGNRIIQTFRADKQPGRMEGTPRGNYIMFQGGVVRLGKLTMTDADLALIDSDTSDPFDFQPDKLMVQLVAGYSKTTPDGGLRTFLPDFDDVQNKRGRR